MGKVILSSIATLAGAAILAAPAGAAQTAHFSVQAIQTSSHRGPHHTFVFTQRLRRHHRAVGHSRVQCGQARRRHVVHCHAVFFLHAGKIKAVGNFGRGNHKLAVVGGTSGFNGVSGKLLVHGGGGKRSRLEFLAVMAATAAARTESRFSLVEVQKSQHRAGNKFITHGVLYVPGTSTVAGTDRVKFSRHGNVHAVVRFPDGKLKAQGNIDASRILVVGGSGRWNGAAGKINVRPLSHRKTLLRFAIVQ